MQYQCKENFSKWAIFINSTILNMLIPLNIYFVLQLIYDSRQSRSKIMFKIFTYMYVVVFWASHRTDNG